MARYTCTFAIPCSQEQIVQWLPPLLKGCQLDLIYEDGDYMRAREVPGQVSFTELVEVEVLIETPDPDAIGINLNIIVSNEELPLKASNHCRTMSERVSDAIQSHQDIKTLNYATD